ncbi:DUF6770 family protein [Pontibacter sp. MBLB2868]|uniref:DUF6770 family protein n=1 Tax=Pontibacter sp. MBLB2868 TaxID=3451555 RepID=UPI003F753AF4
MKTQLRVLLTNLLLLCTLISYAQTQTLKGFSNFRKNALTPIYEGSEVKGYTMFYRADKADKKNDNFGLDFYDQDLKKVKSVTLQKERYATSLLRNAYNGEAFCFYFYNTRTKSFELDVYDRSLKKIATKSFTKNSKGDLQVTAQEINLTGIGENKAMSGMNLYAVPNKGFIRSSYMGMMKGYSLEMYDNKLKLLWTSMSDKKSKDYESLLLNDITDKYVLATIARRPNMLSKQLTFSMAALDVKTGKMLFDIAIENEKDEQLSISSFSYDNKKDEFVAMGEYYALDDKPGVNKSEGFFIKRIGLDGKVKSKKFYSWNKEVNPLLPEAAKQSLEDGFVNFVHTVIRGADGKQHIVAEQYKVKADGLGIAMAVLGGGTSTVKGVVGNAMIYSLDQDLNLEKVNFIEKDQTNCILPPGSGFYGTGMIGMVIKMIGGFNYQFTQQESEQNSFNTAFINYKEVKKSKYKEKSLVNVIYSGQSAPLTDNVELVSSKDAYSYVYPAKAGHVLVLNSLPDNHELELKLVKLNK